MHLPYFRETQHPLIKSLTDYSDRELLTLFQRHPESGRYFTAIFCRYSPIVYTLISHSARSPVQADYLFACTWRHIYYELGGLHLRSDQTQPGDPPLTLQNALINFTAFCINNMELPPVESIYYNLKDCSPPLWCYVEQAMDQLEPVLRLMILLSQTFHWSETRIAAYLQAEGESISPFSVKTQLQQALASLEAALPNDIRTIYLNDQSSGVSDASFSPNLSHSPEPIQSF
ncbi:sigma-70 region 4 domain-containing protein [Roseofilum sp. BLCC_M154]|uniref:Sigma-70 region 4 domain-containing protein n=1 Tax=Roseofilum acuticapitatum BLCC-M154 TaxID=3022444 RepID=A0ABT7AXE2_9CYAN|nr:sigma-70 region 4 domain-containing protein [Roseofilum acuticapitatum]MDJ1171587.1 sigma-70 region 4 domain-containing protein [Roseofilum acuticapitatum BLCC-M154]